MKKELRSTPTEVRAVSDETGRHLSAYAAKYGILSTMLYDPQIGEYYEIIQQGAFSEAVSDDVTCNVDHDDLNNFLGRTPNSLTLTDDETGLFFDCLLPDTEVGNKAFIHSSAPRSDIRSCSFAFDVLEEEWGMTDDGCPLRTVIKVKLYDVAIVIRPAYEFDTELSVRSLERAKAAAPKPVEPQQPSESLAFRRRWIDLMLKL